MNVHSDATNRAPDARTAVAAWRRSRVSMARPLQDKPDAGSGGLRARLGVILPSVNTVVEPWFNATVPVGVTVHTTRMLLEGVTAESLKRMDEQEGLPAALRLASCRPAAIAYGCTASSIVQGLDYDRHLAQELSAKTGSRCVTAVGAILDALRVLGVRRLAMASPYPDAIDAAEHAFFERAGFSIEGSANLGIADGFDLASPTAEEIYSLAERALRGEPDAIVITCLNLNSQSVAASLEERTGLPVVTSTTATLWRLLRAAGIDDAVPGYGRLLDEPFTLAREPIA